MVPLRSQSIDPISGIECRHQVALVRYARGYCLARVLQKTSLVAFVESAYLSPCFFGRPAAQVAAGGGGEAVRFFGGGTAFAAFRGFCVKLLGFAGRATQVIEAKDFDRPFFFANRQVEHVAGAQYAGGFDGGAVELDVAGVDGFGGQ